MKPPAVVGLALLLMSSCDHPYQAESRESVGRLDLTQARTRALMRAADADSGYGECLIAGCEGA
jgi:hypothetical protein